MHISNRKAVEESLRTVIQNKRKFKLDKKILNNLESKTLQKSFFEDQTAQFHQRFNESINKMTMDQSKHDNSSTERIELFSLGKVSAMSPGKSIKESTGINSPERSPINKARRKTL